MNLCIGILFLFGLFAQIRFENNDSWIIGGLLLFGIGFGWYACKAKQDNDLKNGKKISLGC